MNFPYFVLPDQKLAIPRPLLPIKYKFKNHSTREMFALVDSGADYSFAGLAIALELGISLRDVKPVLIQGFNGVRSGCFPKEVCVEVASRELYITVYFGGSLTQSFIPVLGQEVFF
ncbi:MAG: hypothetical protein HY376_00065 [Candidatus Blackburnbacteria bacterium]|nr:hypothetical protein [Candidatus Blackburnbacteria bacterium]